MVQIPVNYLGNITYKLLKITRGIMIITLSIITAYQIATILSPIYTSTSFGNNNLATVMENSIQAVGLIITELALFLIAAFIVHLLLLFFTGEIKLNPIKKDLKKTSFIKDRFALAILLVAAMIRIYILFNLSANLDEGIYSMIIPAINFRDPLPSLESGALYLRGLPYTYLAAFLNMIIRDPIRSARIVSYFFGLLLFPALYKLVTAIHSKEAARIAISLTAIFPTLILYSAQARQYSMNIAIYTLILLLLTRRNISWKLIIPLMLVLSFSHEFVFLLIPFLILRALSEKQWRSGILLAAIVMIGFLVQYFIFTKVTSQEFITFSSGGKALIALNIRPSMFREGFKRIFSSTQFFLILYPVFTLILIRGYRLIKSQELLLLYSQLLIELSFFSFILVRGQTRYRLTLVVLLIIITAISLVDFYKSAKKKRSAIILLSVFFLLTPITLDIPYDTKFPKENIETIASLSLNIYNQPHGYASFAGEAPISNYGNILEFAKELSGRKVITTDLYNLRVYTEIDYVYNIQLQTYSSFFELDSPQTYRNIYHDTPFISTPELFFLIEQGDKLALVFDNRSYYHIPQEIRDHIATNSEMHIVAKNERTGDIHRSSDNGIYLFLVN